MPLPAPGRVGHVVLMEETRGERIREHVVEGRAVDGAWIPLCRGTSVGHKRIERFPGATVTAIRLRVTRAVARPLLKEVAAYGVG